MISLIPAAMLCVCQAAAVEKPSDSPLTPVARGTWHNVHRQHLVRVHPCMELRRYCTVHQHSICMIYIVILSLMCIITATVYNVCSCIYMYMYIHMNTHQ